MRTPLPSVPGPARCIGYCRVSTERQAGEVFTSLADQRTAIEQLAARLDVAVDRWFTDAGASGATVAKRPEFSALLAFCQANPRRRREPGLVLCLNASRFGRFPDPDQAAALRFQLKESGWQVRFAENDDTDNVTLRHVMRSIGDAQSTEYRDNLRRNSRRGARGVAEQGYWRVEAPIGYRRKVVYPVGSERVLDVGIRKADNEKVRLTPGPQREQDFVRWLFASYDAGTHTLGDLVRAANEKWPARFWSRGTIAAVLRNPAYAGDVVCGRRVSDPVEPGDSWSTPSDEWYGKRDAHPALIDRDRFERVLSRLRSNRKQGRAARGVYLFSGLVLCATCGRPMVGGGGGRSDRDPAGVRRFYKCTSTNIAKPGQKDLCPGKVAYVMRNILEPTMLGLLTEIVSGPVVQRAIAKALDDALAELREHAGTHRAKLDDRRQQLERQRANLLDAIADGTVTRNEVTSRLEAIRKELETVSSGRERSLFASRGAQHAALERDRLLKMATDFAGLTSTLSGAALRELVKPWLHRAEFQKHERTLTLWVRRVPAVGLLHTVNKVGTSATERSLIVRRVSLKQPAVGKRIAAGGGR